jgi:hypothetical protein
MKLRELVGEGKGRSGLGQFGDVLGAAPSDGAALASDASSGDSHSFSGPCTVPA